MCPRTAFESFVHNEIKLAKPVIKLKGAHVLGTCLTIYSEDAPDQAVDDHAKKLKISDIVLLLTRSHTWLGS